MLLRQPGIKKKKQEWEQAFSCVEKPDQQENKTDECHDRENGNRTLCQGFGHQQLEKGLIVTNGMVEVAKWTIAFIEQKDDALHQNGTHRNPAQCHLSAGDPGVEKKSKTHQEERRDYPMKGSNKYDPFIHTDIISKVQTWIFLDHFPEEESTPLFLNMYVMASALKSWG
jgi:hypothetical protein